MFDAFHRHFDKRTLIVGLSRVTHGSAVAVATLQQQEWLVGRIRQHLRADGPEEPRSLHGAPAATERVPMPAYHEDLEEEAESATDRGDSDKDDWGPDEDDWGPDGW